MMSNQKWQRAALLIAAAVIVTTIITAVFAAATATGDPCTYRIERGDTLTGIARQHHQTVPRLVELNDIADPDVIYAGDRLRVCDNSPGLSTRPVLVPRHAEAWAIAVDDAAPSWATRNDVLFVVAVAHFESSWCEHVWNPRDAGRENGVDYLGSYGCVQIRVTADGHPAHRNLDLLRDNPSRQAEAAWIIASDRRTWGDWRAAWGPWQRKLADDCTTVGRWETACREAWTIAATVTPTR